MLCSSIDLDNEQRFYFLSKFLDENDANRGVIKKEFYQIISNEEFDLHRFVTDHDELIENIDLYTRDELVSYLKMWLWDYLYPEKILSKNQIDKLQQEVVSILKKCSGNKDWMFSYDLYDVLKEDKKYKDLEYYNLWKLDFYASNIERKPIEEKYQEIGYLRYKE